MNKFIAVVILLIMATALSAAADRDAVITISPQTVIGKVNPLIFGNNQIAATDYEFRRKYGNGIWSPARLMPMPSESRPVPEYVELSKQAGITIQRWPNGASNYNWKRAVGPVRERLNIQFGLPEFLAFCEASNSIPLITIDVSGGEPGDAADLVDYLNRPSNGSNPIGGKDWAALRAADGHAKPYGVIWFEYGNEEYSQKPKTKENPNPRFYRPEEYAARYLKYQAAMKAIDPGIKLGAVMQYGEWQWNRKVLEVCGKQMDFAIEHTYVPVYLSNNNTVSGALLMKASTASDVQMQERYNRLLVQIKEITGRDDVPLAITEYNGLFVQDKPLQYRQTLANALRNAENLRIMMKPENHILMANFWQFANDYFGMVQGHMPQGRMPVKQANFFPYQLYHEHFGDTLIGADVQCSTWDFAGAAEVPARYGQPRQYKLLKKNLLPKDYKWVISKSDSAVKQKIDGKIAVAEFLGNDVNYFYPQVKMPAEPSTGYRITGYIKTENLIDKAGVSYEVQDARGWVATRYAVMGYKVKGNAEWTKVQVDFVTLSDTSGIEIIARRLSGSGPVSGKAWFRLESVQQFQPANAGAVPDLGVNSAKRSDGTVTVMVVNKNTEEAVLVHLNIAGVKTRENAAKAWLLSGPSCFANNLENPNSVGINDVAVGIGSDTYYLSMPPCSMAAIEIKP